MPLLIKNLAFTLITLSGMCYADGNIDIARLSLDEATRKILHDEKKRVLGATTVIIDGREVHVIKVLTPDGRIRHYKIDAETGSITG
ncbi:MAG: PepSY domain-containing protein [Methyloglobulus sp.]|nr:PepSY domain-containing protein [Methyloglobulus sp.]